MKTQVTRGLTVALVLLGVMIWMPPETEAQGLIRLSAEFQNFDDTESATNLVVPGSVVYRKPIVVGDRHDYLVRLTAALVLLGVMIVVAAQATATITTSTQWCVDLSRSDRAAVPVAGPHTVDIRMASSNGGLVFFEAANFYIDATGPGYCSPSTPVPGGASAVPSQRRR